MNPQLEQVAKQIFPDPCRHIHDDGTSALLPVGQSEDHLEICDICSKVVTSNPPDEDNQDLV